MTPATMAVPLCPRDATHGPMFDNRGDKASAKAPDFRCRVETCTDPATGRRTALWARDLLKKQPAAPTNGTQRPEPAPTPEPAPDAATEFQRLTRLHYKALQFCLTHELKLIEKLPGDVAGAIAAMAATIMIATLKEDR